MAPLNQNWPESAANRQVEREQGIAAESGDAGANKAAEKTNGAESNSEEEQNTGVFWGSASLTSKPRLLLFVTEDTYHPCRYQHRDNPTDRHGEAV